SSSVSFSNSDFLVQANIATDNDQQDLSSDLASTQCQIGFNDGMLAGTISADQAYDAFVFYLVPSNLATITTVNVADLIVGPDSMAPSVSPLGLSMPTMPASFHMEQYPALASLYGFTDASLSHSTRTDASRLAKDQSIDTDYALQINAEITSSLDSLDMHLEAAPSLEPMPEQQQQQQTVTKDPTGATWEALVARISNDLGSEHLASLFETLKGVFPGSSTLMTPLATSKITATNRDRLIPHNRQQPRPHDHSTTPDVNGTSFLYSLLEWRLDQQATRGSNAIADALKSIQRTWYLSSDQVRGGLDGVSEAQMMFPAPDHWRIEAKGVDTDDGTSTPKTFKDFSSARQACMCAIGYDTSPFMKCNPLCPPNNMDLITRAFDDLAAAYCKPDGSGPLNSSSSSASSISCLHLASVAAAIVISAVALA
ncbi:hypothetical protein KVV02_002198, partial [Mortierella alpina]